MRHPSFLTAGYSKQWGTQHWRFSIGRSAEGLQFSIKSAAATSDEKFLSLATSHIVLIFAVDGFKFATVLKSDFGLVRTVEFTKTPGDGGKGCVLATHSEKGLSGAERQIKILH